MMQDSRRAPLRGRRVLVVEDEYFIAEELRQQLEAQGAKVLGPVPRVSDALELLDQTDPPDMAVLDVNLGDEMVFPVAEALKDKDVPFIFVTAYEPRQLPRDYAQVPRCEKPVNPHQLVQLLATISP